MRKHDLAIGLILVQGCVPTSDRDAAEKRHLSGVEWQLDENGTVISIRAVLVERDGGQGRVLGSEGVVPLDSSLHGGVLRVVEVRAAGKRVLDLTPVSDDEFGERVRAYDATAAPAIR